MHHRRNSRTKSGLTDPPFEQEGASQSEQLLFGGPLRHDQGWNKHENAYLEMSLWTMALRLPRLIASTVRLARRADPGALRTVAVAEITHGVSQAIGLVAVNDVLAAVLAAGPTGGRLHDALPSLLIVAVTAVVGALATSASTSGTGRLEPKVERVATEMYLERVIHVELAAIEDEEFHRLLDSAQYGASSARRMIKYCTAVVGALVAFAAAAGVLTVLHPVLLPLLALTTLPRSWAALRNARARYASFQRWVQHSRAGRLLSNLLIRPEPAPEVRVHGVGPFLLRHYRSMSESAEAEQTRLARDAARTRLIAAALTGAAALGTYAALGCLLLTGVMRLSVAGTAVLATRSGSASLATLILQVNNLYEEACYVQDLERLCREAGERAIPSGGSPVPEDPREIRFENVSFTYPGSDATARPALDDVSLSIPGGKVVALVGENGSGKSTLVKLLAGLYRPDRGHIRWDGQDADGLDRAEMFSRFAMVSQDFQRWPFTCRMNVAIGRTEVPVGEERLAKAARYAGADDMIAGLPRGWDTLLARGYQGGHQLSGGQWQRLGIARARYREGRVLIVDEPTSALDARAELQVFEQIRRLADQGQTVLLITHRLASVRQADVIHVLEGGRLRESGTFEELMRHSPAGIFRDLYRLQRDQFAEDDPAVPGARRSPDPAETVSL